MVDELIRKANPVVLGSGIPPFSGTADRARLELAEGNIHKGGFPMFRYLMHRRKPIGGPAQCPRSPGLAR